MDVMFMVFGFMAVGIISSAVGACIAAPIAFWLGRRYRTISVEIEKE